MTTKGNTQSIFERDPQPEQVKPDGPAGAPLTRSDIKWLKQCDKYPGMKDDASGCFYPARCITCYQPTYYHAYRGPRECMYCLEKTFAGRECSQVLRTNPK